MTIVVGFVPTPEGRSAVRVAIDEAQQRSEPIVLVNAATGDQRVDSAYASDEELGQARSLLEEAGLDYRIVQQVGKTGAQTVLETASSAQARVIVIGLRRRSPSGKFFFGSTSQEILLEADCPVLAVKAPADGVKAPG